MSDIKPCPFCGAENPRADSHADNCYFTLHRALNNAPEADLSLTFDVIEAWNRRAAIEAQRVPDGWRPIETAPKTSRSILVHCAERKNTYTVTWGRDVEFPWWEHFSGGSLNESPTHWMPLPAAPGSAAPPVAQPGIPLEDSIAWQAGAFNPLNPKTAVTVEGHAWYRHDHPKVTQSKPEQAQPAERKPLSELHINQGSADAAAGAYEADYWAAQAQAKAELDRNRGALQSVSYYVRDAIQRMQRHGIGD